MKEFRFLDQKRQTTGLSAEETTRYAQLRDLVGPDTNASAVRAGFDVGAAAARLRESLLPGGLRGQAPAPPPEPEPEPLAPPEAEAAPEALALETAWADQPFAPLEAEAAPDPLFDPSSLGTEVRPQAWNPEAPGYDPDAPYDEAAWIAAGYDPNATYDWSAYQGAQPGTEPAAEGVPPEASAELPAAEGYADAAGAGQPAAWDGAEPAAEAPAEPVQEAVAEALGLGVLEPFAASVEPLPPAAAEPLEAGAEPILVEELDAAPDLGPQPVPGAEPELPFDPNAPFDHAKWFGRPAPAAPSAPTPAPLPELLVEPVDELAPESIELEPEPLAPEAVPAAAADAPPEAAWPAAELPAPIEILEEGEAAFAAAAVEPPGPTLEPPLEPAAEAPWTDAPGPEPLDLELELVAEAAPEPLLVPEPAELAPAEAPPAGPAAVAASESWFDAATEPPPAPALFGDYDADGRGVPAGLAAMMVEPLPEPPPPVGDDLGPIGDGSDTPYQPAPPGAPFGEYDETAPARPPLDPGLADALHFDPAAAAAIAPGELPEGYDPGGPALDPDALPPAPPGGYDDASAFAADPSYGGPEGDSVPGGAPLELGEPVQDWQPEQALEQGFQLASDGSFGELERPALTPVPGWASTAAAPAEGWESPPALDLGAPFELAQPPAAEELPTLAGEDVLEEVSPLALEPILEPVEPEPVPEPAPEPVLEPVLEPALEAAPEPSPEVPAPAWAPPEPPPATEAVAVADEIPPEIAAAFGDAPAVPAEDPFAPAGAAPYEPPAEPSPLPPEPQAWAPPAAPAGSLFSEPPPSQGLAFGTSEPEPVLEEAPLPPLPPLEPPEPEPIVEPEPLPEAAAPQVWIEGSHRVVLHTVDGQVKRGLLVDAALDAADLTLQPQGPGVPEAVPTDGVKAIFFMLAPGEKAATPEGRKVRVTFRDGRQVAGYSPDYREGTIGFFMIPADTRTNTGRIWVYQSAVRQVAVS